VQHIVKVLGLILLLSGCTTAAQRQYQSIAANTRTAKENLQVFSLAVYNSPAYELLKKHLPSNINQLTL
jgi:hypothetical protein